MIVGYLKKWSKILCCLIVLSGCTRVPQNNVIESTEPFIVELFYAQTCPNCKMLKDQFLPRLLEEFENQVTIIEYDIDLKESQDLYYQYIGLYDHETQTYTIESQLKNVPKNALCNDDMTKCDITYIPFVVIGDMYAFMGYSPELLEDYVQDVHLALQGQPLTTGQAKIGRWEFK